jgi:hypothetical protein
MAGPSFSKRISMTVSFLLLLQTTTWSETVFLDNPKLPSLPSLHAST